MHKCKTDVLFEKTIGSTFKIAFACNELLKINLVLQIGTRITQSTHTDVNLEQATGYTKKCNRQ